MTMAEPAPKAIHLGTSGWDYHPWQAHFYAGVPRRAWLSHYAGRFETTEINASFYRFVRGTTYARWREATPPAFRFAVKGHRAVTHERQLVDVADLIAKQRDAAAELGPKLAAVLWQLPRRVVRDDRRLEGFLAALRIWPGPRHVMEFRHESWFRAEVAARLAAHGVAVAVSDAGRWPRWDVATADLVYVRLHGRPHTYISAYAEDALRAWADRARHWRDEGRDVYVYFDNTKEEAAPGDAERFRRLVDAPDAPAGVAAATA